MLGSRNGHCLGLKEGCCPAGNLRQGRRVVGPCDLATWPVTRSLHQVTGQGRGKLLKTTTCQLTAVASKNDPSPRASNFGVAWVLAQVVVTQKMMAYCSDFLID